MCTSYIPTQNTTKFAYNVGAGVRYDFGPYLVRGLANELQVPMPATAIAHDMVLAANATGKSGMDFSAVALLMEELAGARES